MTEFEVELRDKLVERLDLVDVEPDSVSSDTPLFDEGLGLDSIDALEIAVMVEEAYGIVIQTSERTRENFGTLGGLASFVQQNMHRDQKKS